MSRTGIGAGFAWVESLFPVPDSIEAKAVMSLMDKCMCWFVTDQTESLMAHSALSPWRCRWSSIIAIGTIWAVTLMGTGNLLLAQADSVADHSHEENGTNRQTLPISYSRIIAPAVPDFDPDGLPLKTAKGFFFDASVDASADEEWTNQQNLTEDNPTALLIRCLEAHKEMEQKQSSEHLSDSVADWRYTISALGANRLSGVLPEHHAFGTHEWNEAPVALVSAGIVSPSLPFGDNSRSGSNESGYRAGDTAWSGILYLLCGGLATCLCAWTVIKSSLREK